MKNKKLFIPIVAFTVMSLTMPVFAATNLNKENASGTTTVSYGITEGYTVSIPTAVNFTSSDLEQTGEVSASNVLIENGKTLTVKMSSANHTEEDGYTLNYGDGEVSKIKYSIQNNGADFTNGGTVLTVEAGNTEGDTSTLTFTTSDENIAAATKSGAHTDTLTFTVEVN